MEKVENGGRLGPLSQNLPPPTGPLDPPLILSPAAPNFGTLRVYLFWATVSPGQVIFQVNLSGVGRPAPAVAPYTWAEKFESFERINSIRETNGNFDSCNSCKRLGTSRLHELHESKFPFVSRIEFIRSKLSNFSAHVYGISGVKSMLSLVAGSPAHGRIWVLTPFT